MLKYRWLIGLVVLLLVGAGVAARGYLVPLIRKPANTPSEGVPAEPSKKLPAQPPEKLPDVVATMLDGRITGVELDRRARVVLAFAGVKKPDVVDDANERLAMAWRAQATGLARLVLLEGYAQQDGVRVPEAEAERRWQEMLKTRGADTLLAMLNSWEVGPEDAKRELRRELLWQEYARRYAEDAEKHVITEEAIRRTYDGNRDKYRVPDMIRLRGILVKTREEAERVRERLKGGADFAELAREVSTDPTAKHGGDAGWIRDDRLNVWLRIPLEKVKTGEISPVIVGPPGFYVVRVEARKPGRPLAYKEVHEQIRKELAQAEGNSAVRNLVHRLSRERQLKLLYPTASPQ